MRGHYRRDDSVASITYVDGQWLEGNPPLLGPMDQSFWFATMVFDGARSFDGVAPDLDLHCQRLFRSAEVMRLKPPVTLDEVINIGLRAAAHFPRETALYIRPILFATKGWLWPEPDENARFVLTAHEAPLPSPDGISVCLSRYRRPAPDMAPTLAKASCLYPTTGMAIKEAVDMGFDNVILLDHEGNVAEFGTANLFIAKDGVAHTPVFNGTFLDGITKNRVIGLLRDTGVEVVERTLTIEEVRTADEIFSTGNYGKVIPVTRVDDREIPIGPIFRKAREFYFAFARECALRVPKRP